MIDGFLLFVVVDVWRMILPMGISLILFVTLLIERWEGQSFDGGLRRPLMALAARGALCLLVISGVVGILVPWGIGYSLPLSHLAVGPWSHDELAGFLIATMLLWFSYTRSVRANGGSPLWVGGAAGLFLVIALVWTARWDMMANVGTVPNGLMVGNLSSWDWPRIVPKFFHLVFASLVAGGLIVVGMGLFKWASWYNAEEQGQLSGPIDCSGTTRYGVGWMLSGLVPQMLVGPWLFLVLGEGARGQLVDGMSLTSVIFFVSLTAYLLALVLLNAAFMVPRINGLVWGGLISALITLVLMGVVRYEMFVATTQFHHIPLAFEKVTLIHLGTVVLFTVLLAWIFLRWCVWPLAYSSPSPKPSQRLDKPMSGD